MAGAVGDSLEMAHVRDMLSDRSDPRVAVLTGAGKAFSAGADLIEDMSLRDGYRYEQPMTTELADHPDPREAAAACLAKRHPVCRYG